MVDLDFQGTVSWENSQPHGGKVSSCETYDSLYSGPPKTNGWNPKMKELVVSMIEVVGTLFQKSELSKNLCLHIQHHES